MKIAAILSTGLRRVLGRLTLTPTGYRAQAAVAALLILVAGGSGTKVVMDRMDALPDGAVFRASGQVVTEQQLQHRVDLMEFLYGLQRPTDPQQLDPFERSVAKAIAVSGIVDDAARGAGIVIADKAASDQLQKMLTDGTWPDRDTFLRQLGAHGLSEQDVLDEIKRQQSSARLFAQVTAPVKASTDADAQRYYDQNRAQMVSPEQRDVSNIVVSAQDQAQQVAQLARAGSDIGALARQYSLDGSTKDNGGALGTVRAGQLDPAYAKAAFAAPGGSVFGPVQTAQGWNVGKVTQVHPAVPLSFTDVRDAIKTKLDNDAKLKVWDDFLVQRIKAAAVVYAPQYRPADPDAPPQAGT